MTGIAHRRAGLWRAGVLLGLLAALGCAWPARAAQGRASAPPAGTFLSISDIHFNPFSDSGLVAKLVRSDVRAWDRIFAGSKATAVSAYGSDTNEPLLRSTLAALRRTVPHPDFILISGDFLSHGFKDSFQKESPDTGPAAYPSFVRKTIAFVTARLRRAFPGVPIFPALGNNDSFCGDYEVELAGPFLAAVGTLWRPLLGRNAGTFDQTFPVGGFYSVRHPTVPRLRIVVLNTVFLSRKYENVCGSGSDPAALQLGWLAYTLQRAALAGEKVWVLEHIPPGIDVFSTLGSTGSCQSNPVTLWQPAALTAWQQAMAAAPGVVTASFAGHTHIDDFRLPGDGSFVHGTPAVSPVYANNPGFQIFTYDRSSGALTDLRTFYLDLSAPGSAPWALEYSFRQAYGQSAYTESALRSVQQGIVDDPAVRGVFLSNYPVHSEKGAVDPQNWKAFACGIVAFTPQDFASCYCPPP